MSTSMLLSESDRNHLADFLRLLDLLHDRTLGVGLKYNVGTYITGRAGTSKTHTVLETLHDNDINHVIRDSRMSPMGLWKTLKTFPDHVIVLDDLPTAFKNDETLQILLAALGGRAIAWRKTQPDNVLRQI